MEINKIYYNYKNLIIYIFLFNELYKLIIKFIFLNNISQWGLGIGDWGLGIGDWAGS